MDIDDLDGQYVTGLGVGQRDGTREWVEAVPVEARENAGVGIGPDLSVRDLASVVDDRVARLDRKGVFELVVPDVVNSVFGEVMCLRHAADLLVVRSLKVLSQFASYLSSETTR